MKLGLSIQTWKLLSDAEKHSLLNRPAMTKQPEVARRVKQILEGVKTFGDEMCRRLTSELDGVALSSLEVSEEEKRDAIDRLDPLSRAALVRAQAQIERFHEACLPKPVRLEVSPGLVCSRIPRPIETVGLYIPGGTASLPSTVLMLGVPARLAGCRTRILCSPPRQNGGVDPYVLLAAELCGIERVFKLGGAQAIGAMAYGTSSVPKVDKIFGPGNSWVTEAKLQVSTDPAGAMIDMPAGPSEVLVIADGEANAEFVAADLLSQAEHGADSQVVLLSDRLAFIETVITELERQLPALPRRSIAEQSLAHSRFIWVEDMETALTVSNRYAPEHLILQVAQPEALAEKVVNAGSVFLGAWSPEAMGDYASGTNHVLPTYGLARSMSGVSVDSFVKQITFQALNEAAITDLGPTVERLATIEGLEAHRNAVTVRLDRILKDRGERP